MTRDEVCSKFLESLPYTLYPFQEEALLAWFASEAGVLIAAPTGMGKTLIAEAAVFEALHTGQRLYYTTPLIALTDQKFRDFQELAGVGFRRDDVGLITAIALTRRPVASSWAKSCQPLIARTRPSGHGTVGARKDEFTASTTSSAASSGSCRLCCCPSTCGHAAVGHRRKPLRLRFLEKHAANSSGDHAGRATARIHWSRTSCCTNLLQMSRRTTRKTARRPFVFAFNATIAGSGEKLKGWRVSNKQKQEIEPFSRAAG